VSRGRWKRTVAVLALGPVAALALVVGGALPVQAVANNSTLGALDPASPGSNQYSGCVAATLTGDGFVFGSPAALGSELAALWPTLPSSLASTCHQAVQTLQPQVCVSPANPALCPNVGAAAETQLANQANTIPGTWKLIPDASGGTGAAQTPLDQSAAARSPMSTVTGTFTTPATVCDSPGSCSSTTTGLWTNCGYFTCGPVTQMVVTFTGRTPDMAGMPNGENAVLGRFHAVDGHGHTVADGLDTYGNNSSGVGCGGPEPHQCNFNASFGWNCTDAAGASANCGSQSITVGFTFLTAWPGQASPLPSVGQHVQLNLSAQLLDWHANPACPNLADCQGYDDSRVSYGGSDSSPSVVDYSAAPLPAAVINLDPANLGCLVGANVLAHPDASCNDITHAKAPIVQPAHAPVAPPTPPSVGVTSVPAAGAGIWDNTPVTATIQAKDQSSVGIASVNYLATGAQPIAQTSVSGATATVKFSNEGVSTLTYWATDNAGGSSAQATFPVQLDFSPPTFSCAAPDGKWHAADVSLACSAADSLSGLAATSPAGFQLSTSVPAGTETAAAATGSQKLCDLAGNCTTAGPIAGNRVDRKAPGISIQSPAGAYVTGQSVQAGYTCSDGGSGIAKCGGNVASGAAVDTSKPGTYSFTVNAADQAGNQAQQTSSYSVGYRICELTGRHGGRHEGATVRLRFTVCDAAGHNLSSSALKVRATGLLQVSTGAVLPVPGTLRFKHETYSIRLDNDDLPDGDYKLLLSIAGDPQKYSLPFRLYSEHEWPGGE